jgi:membrane protein YqaA with SNARE-associated domain
LKTIRHIIARYTAFLWALLQPLGIWGPFVIAALDSAAMGLPLDVVVAGYVYKDHARFWLYVLMASAGSALGSIVLYIIGYKGGEELLRKRMSPERFEKFHQAFDKHPFWSLMFPSMLPPPTPFKLIVLTAAASEMQLSHFLMAIFFGRCIRFFILSMLTIKFGPGFLEFSGKFLKFHWPWVLAGVGVALAIWLIVLRMQADQKVVKTEAVD